MQPQPTTTGKRIIQTKPYSTNIGQPAPMIPASIINKIAVVKDNATTIIPINKLNKRKILSLKMISKITKTSIPTRPMPVKSKKILTKTGKNSPASANVSAKKKY